MRNMGAVYYLPEDGERLISAAVQVAAYLAAYAMVMNDAGSATGDTFCLGLWE